MYVIRLIVIGIFLAGVLAGIGWLADNGIPAGITGTLLVVGGGFVGLKMVGGLFARGNAPTITYAREGSRSRPEFRVLEEGKDAAGRPYFIIQGDSHDASKVTEGWTYPGNVSWVHTHLGHYKWKIHVEDWKVD